MARISRQGFQSSGAAPEDLRISMDLQKWRICVYVRLSREDERNISRKGGPESQPQSESIMNQKSILRSWIEDYFEPGSYEIAGYFEDDGLTGTDDEREGFMRMVGTIERGEANCVVVKTLSRAFRNYSDQGYYLEEFFPSRNVRFISTMDSFVDTYMDSEAIYNLDVPMYGLLNDRFAAATSRSVRRTFDDKRSKGKFIGAFPPYGFLKDPEDKNHLILDPDTVPVKLQMKDWLLHEGLSLGAVARRLNAMGVPNPARYKQMKGWKYCNPHARGGQGLWCAATVKNVLLTQMNLGHMVQGRQRVMSYKIHDRITVPESSWFVVENMHEATFTQEDYTALCALFERKTRASDSRGTVHKFAGLLKCGCCGRAMHRSHVKNHIYYKCETRKNKGPAACQVKSIREDRLERAVLGAIQGQMKLVESLETVIEEAGKNSDAKDSINRLEKLFLDKERELERMQNVFDCLYEDWKFGEVSEKEYRRMRERCETKMDQLKAAAEKIREEADNCRKQVSEENPLFESLLQYGNIKELSRSVLLSLIDVIYVHGAYKITIKFKFEDELLRIARATEGSLDKRAADK